MLLIGPEGRISLHHSSTPNPTQGVASQVIKGISKISDLSAETIEEYRQYGWTDEEIVENLNDTINFLNSNLHSNELTESEIPLRSIFRIGADPARPLCEAGCSKFELHFLSPINLP